MAPGVTLHAILPIALYVRISDDPYKLRAGVTRQRQDCAALASARWPEHPHRVYEDNDQSASRYAHRAHPRPAFTRLCDDLDSNLLFAIVGWDFDRLFRHPRELEQFLDLADRHHFTRALTAQGDVDLTTNDGRLHARIMVAVAAKESDDKSRRIRRVIRDKQERGLHDGKSVVYGYKLVEGVPIVVPQEAEVVRHTARLLLGGTTLAALARQMPPGAPQTRPGVRRMLLSPTLAGFNTAGVRGTWTPILDDQTAADVRALLSSPERSHGAAPRRWWLSGLVYCGACQTRLPSKQVRGETYYACEECYRVGINARKLHAHMELELFAAVEALEPAPTVVPQSSQLTGSVVASDDRLAQLAIDYATGAITRTEWVAARDAIANLQRNLIHHHPLASPSLVPVLDLPARWDAWTPSEQHAQASRLLRRVLIHPARVRGQWDPGRIVPEWIV